MSVCGSWEIETPVLSDCFKVNGPWKPLYNFSCHALLYIPQVILSFQVAISQLELLKAVFNLQI